MVALAALGEIAQRNIPELHGIICNEPQIHRVPLGMNLINDELSWLMVDPNRLCDSTFLCSSSMVTTWQPTKLG